MYVEVEMERTILVAPDVMRSDDHIKRGLLQKLMADFNSIKCTEQHGYYVVLTTLENIGEGRLWERKGYAAYPVRFKCIVFKPFQNEMVLAIVDEINATGLFCNCGPLEKIYVSGTKDDRRIPADSTKRPTSTANALEEYEFMNDDPSWKNMTTEATITKGSVVILKIRGVNWNEKERIFVAIGILQRPWKELDKEWPLISASGGAAENVTEPGVAGVGWETVEDPAEAGGWGEDE